MAEIVAFGGPFYVVAGGVRVPLPDDHLVTRTGLPVSRRFDGTEITAAEARRNIAARVSA